ncbi:hypothetical protein A8709_07105 [Paenibacillus pectinilyticus]|uniref:Alpha/beta hydrolase fold-3 domain-containing protein n=2 Tax=Paenibacillus pectinilyticus TaxID=512399 RepID=A0A1C0ZU34_9BACL|nr:hypothetical protein A8709_07105 [Paenibacillus pectinilyticus]
METVFKFIPLRDRRDEDNFNKSLQTSNAPYILPEKYRVKYEVEEYEGFTDTFVIYPENNSSDLFIFYLHGGGYWSQPLSFHFKFFKNVSKELNANFILPVYPKAPSYHAIDVHKMIMERYLYLIHDKGVSAENIILMGESAGGGLALSFLQVLRDQGLPLPKQAILISPWLDVTNTNPAMIDIQPYDPLLNIESLGYGGIIYAGDLDPKDPLVSPIYGDLERLPPITLFSGTHDILHADILKYSKIATEKRWDVTLYTYEKMNHCFVGFPIPEGKEALGIISNIIRGNK